MSRPLRILIGAVSLTLTICLHAADDPVLDRFASYLESLRAQAGIPGLAATIVGPADVIPRGMWERGFGRQNIDRLDPVRADTPFHLDGGTQLVTAALVLRCAAGAEENRLSLDDPVDRFMPNSPEPRATLRQLLSHTSMQGDGLVFSYRLERLDPLASAVAACTGETSFRRAVADFLEQNLMFASVPGPDASNLSASDSFNQSTIDRYRSVMSRLATGYTVSGQGTATTASYSATTLKPATGLITTVRDLAQFDISLKKGSLLPANSISLAWTAPVGRDGRRLPHGLGWFVQSYSGQTVVWQFGSGNASSSMIVTVPARGLTMILLANSSGLAKGFNLTAGDVTVSPFAKAFLGTFLR